jgi:hypothetical protein
MKNATAFKVSTAVTFLALLSPAFVRAQSAQDAQNMDLASTTPAASVAAEMVPAQAVLTGELDAKKLQQGGQFEATLTGKVELKDGTELPRGTVLEGTIAKDDMQSDGTSTLALRFVDAKLKDGTSIPITATIVGVAPPANGIAWDNSDQNEPPAPWNMNVLKVEEIGALSGVNFQSSIGGENSGVFVSNKKHNVRLSARSQISLAIAAQKTVGANGGF